ncbi:MAG: sn-glycerol-1-phosphate dehydrogenase [Christensenella sp.]|uniref:sn-glycerol-1-phosphate dehydrogenase n=1 Tax=Christensenella sp. TaxID=1935934 RepID=UPI002B208960|nr:sn-glycerol-1-phosphate dehydrogenase [Christensenella sp.]MEA5002864.1 sn-glycerol-1-phosphate dehydrogenase [Christensenella sp.]
MKSIVETPVEKLATISFDCDCGNKHSIDIQKIVVGEGVLPSLMDMVEPFKDGKILMVSDQNTFEAAGETAYGILQKAGCDVKSFVFQTGCDILIPDKKALGRLFMELEPDTSLMIAVGSGTINDLTKYVAARAKIPYIVICTAPSMDGYASDGAPLICDGFKVSFQGTLAYGIVADIDIMRKAPENLIQAGFGDVIGKYTALADWMLARENVGEYYCETCAEMIRVALTKVVEHAEGIRRREVEGIRNLTEALIMSGVAMGLIGVSRPASGAEHMLSHYWEMYYIAHDCYPELHGIKVGIATPLIAELFEMMRDKLPESVAAICPERQTMEKLLQLVAAPVLPTDIGIMRELLYESLLEAYQVRKRYSIVQLAVEEGQIEDCAEKITNRIYGNATISV